MKDSRTYTVIDHKEGLLAFPLITTPYYKQYGWLWPGQCDFASKKTLQGARLYSIMLQSMLINCWLAKLPIAVMPGQHDVNIYYIYIYIPWALHYAENNIGY